MFCTFFFHRRNPVIARVSRFRRGSGLYAAAAGVSRGLGWGCRSSDLNQTWVFSVLLHTVAVAWHCRKYVVLVQSGFNRVHPLLIINGKQRTCDGRVCLLKRKKEAKQGSERLRIPDGQKDDSENFVNVYNISSENWASMMCEILFILITFEKCTGSSEYALFITYSP